MSVSKRPGARRQADELDQMGYADLMKLGEHLAVDGFAKLSAEELRASIRAKQSEPPPERSFEDDSFTPVIDPVTGDHLISEPAVPVPPAIVAPPDDSYPQRYRVNKSMRFVRDGTVYTLAGGSVVTELTHNLAELRRQGAALEPVAKVEVVRGQLGESVTLLDGTPSTDYGDRPAPEAEIIMPNRGNK